MNGLTTHLAGLASAAARRMAAVPDVAGTLSDLADDAAAAPEVDGPCPQPAAVADALSLCRLIVSVPAAECGRLERLFAALEARLDGFDRKMVRSMLGAPGFRAIHGRLQAVRAGYEYGRERDLARAIAAGGGSRALADFRSRAWYDRAHEFEARLFRPFAFKRVLFVGLGPYPTTALALAGSHIGSSITCVDRCPEACALAERVARMVGGEPFRVVNANAFEITDFTGFDCILVGLVVGATDSEKRQVVRHFLRWVPKTVVLVLRCADGPGLLFYPSIDPRWIQDRRVRVVPDPPQKTFTAIVCHDGQPTP